jgi:pyridoxal phosphate enzyme (YggS family)
MSIAQRLESVRARLFAACEAAGRDPDQVRLIAVSKTKPASAIREAYAAGQRDFGENYAQELRDKAAELSDLPGIRWHFIGHLQRNKVKYTTHARSFRIHAVDSVKLGTEIAKRGPGTGVLVEVNVAGEASKSGVPYAEALDLCAALHALDGVELCGLMCIPPADDQADRWFARMAELQARGLAQGLPVSELSMGMSGDFEQAIAHGASWVRVGTAIFGARNPVKAALGALRG